jgi:diadenylate cyclase
MANWFPLRWQEVVDFLMLSIVIYWLLHWGKQTRALRFFLGIGALLIAGNLASRFDLLVTSWILHLAALSAVVLLVVVYYAEIRHALSHLDLLNRWIRPSQNTASSDLTRIAEAVFTLADSKLGALIVMTGEDSLHDLVNGGIRLEGMISREILEAIFQKKSPVHDGAVIVENSKMARVGAFLPLTNREDLPMSWGTRHRAAMGIAEHSDALVIVVSEERGEVTLVKGREYQTVEKPSKLIHSLEWQRKRPEAGIRLPYYRALYKNWKLKIAALGIAAIFWALIFTSGSSVRSYPAPIEFQNVPAGMEVSNPSVGRVSVQLRASPYLFNAMNWNRIVVTVNLQGMAPGRQTIEISEKNLSLPPGIVFEESNPRRLNFTLTASSSRNSAGGHTSPY